MATPMRVYAEIAERFGVNPHDESAVDRFFLDVAPTLPAELRAAIVGELLARDGEEEMVLDVASLPLPTQYRIAPGSAPTYHIQEPQTGAYTFNPERAAVTSSGTTYILNVRDSTLGAAASGAHANATGTVSVHQTALTQAQHHQHIKNAKKALVDDEERLDAAIYKALERFLKDAREVQVETKPLDEVKTEMNGILERAWAQHGRAALPQGLKVTEALAKSPVTAEVARKLVSVG